MQKAGVNNPGFFVENETLKPVEKTPQICYSTGMENSRLEALFKLLTTEDVAHRPLLRGEVAAALRENPSGVRTALAEQFPGKTPKPVLHILEEIFWENITNGLARFSAKINPDLEEGLALLSQFTDPSVTLPELSAQLDDLARAVRPALVNAVGYTAVAQVLGKYLFGTLQFVTRPARLDLAEVSFSQVLQRRRGSCLCMACLYVVIATRYGLDINVVDVAGRILVHLQEPETAQSLLIDPLDNGKILSEADCRQYVAARQLAWDPAFLTPMTSRQIVRRLLANMIFVLNQTHDERRLTQVRRYLEIVKN